MQAYRFLAFSTPVPGREAEYEHWCDTQHIPDCLKLDGFVAAQRFRIEQPPAGTEVPGWTVMTIYEIESDDIDATMAQIGKNLGTPTMPISDAYIRETSLRMIGVAASARQEQTAA